MWAAVLVSGRDGGVKNVLTLSNMGKAVLEGNEIEGCVGSGESLMEEELRDGGEVRDGGGGG